MDLNLPEEEIAQAFAAFAKFSAKAGQKKAGTLPPVPFSEHLTLSIYSTYITRFN
jgi:hypothetical protein